jgi:hypothetical protein
VPLILLVPFIITGCSAIRTRHKRERVWQEIINPCRIGGLERNSLTVRPDSRSVRAGARDRWCTMRDEFASRSFLAVTVAALVLLCFGLVAFAFT